MQGQGGRLRQTQKRTVHHLQQGVEAGAKEVSGG